MAERDRETIVVTDGGDRGGGSGMVIAIVLLIALIVGGFLLYRSGAFTGGAPEKIDINVKVPEAVDGK